MRFFLLLLVLTSCAAIYKSTDADGNITYSDKPSAFSKKLPLLDHEQQKKLTRTSSQAGYSIKIEEPLSGAALGPDVNTFVIRVSITPRLHDGDKLQLLHNGAAWGELQRKYRFDIINLPRGTHHFEVAIIGKDNTIRTKTNGIVVYQQRNTVYSPLKRPTKSTQSP